jgi:hypothetical protein
MAVDIKKDLKKYAQFFLQAQKDNLNEADTVQRLIKAFEEVFGYDVMTDISREAHMKNKFIDIALKIDGTIRLLVEVKAAGEILRERHIEQAQNYASNNNYHWVLLTNSVVWKLFHLTFGEGIEHEEAFTVDLADEASINISAEKLGLLHKQSIKKGLLEDFWEHNSALNPKEISKSLFHETTLNWIRREIRKNSGILIDIEDLAKTIYEMLTPKAQGEIGQLKIRKIKSSKSTGSPIQKSELPSTATNDETPKN